MILLYSLLNTLLKIENRLIEIIDMSGRVGLNHYNVDFIWVY
nr:MAG TPA: hypothetical protein [Caudoviricetes sp.]